mgnify:CR=1 FL=1
MRKYGIRSFEITEILFETSLPLQMEFCEEYPNRPPRVKFLSKMFHPNIYADGGICLDILRNK